MSFSSQKCGWKSPAPGPAVVWGITFCRSTFPLLFQLSEAVNESYEVNFHFKMPVNDSKYLSVRGGKVWQGERVAGAGTAVLERRHKFSLISLLFLVCLLCFETVSSVLSCL